MMTEDEHAKLAEEIYESLIRFPLIPTYPLGIKERTFSSSYEEIFGVRQDGEIEFCGTLEECRTFAAESNAEPDSELAQVVRQEQWISHCFTPWEVVQ